ncbi:MAG: PKD domain-containing protein, partial [Candidatus Micrarchaeota archaeon]|nr:PKD domain-containing protein [Candidatus Micrarchaeota archaeon]MDE1805006.1 PKD domain-containing protein [Candidatus Micrarchaeota archaeon]
MPAPRVMLASLIILALLFPCTTLSAQSTSTTTNTPFSIDTSFSVLPLSNLVVSGNVYITDPNVANGASISYVTWDWGDGTISAWVPASGPAALTAFPGQHTYLSSGPYQVNVLVGDSAEATGNATGQVQVPGPKFVSPNSIVSFASITVSGHTATPNLIITDPNVATGASLVAEDWSWGDGSADATWGSSQSS